MTTLEKLQLEKETLNNQIKAANYTKFLIELFLDKEKYVLTNPHTTSKWRLFTMDTFLICGGLSLTLNHVKHMIWVAKDVLVDEELTRLFRKVERQIKFINQTEGVWEVVLSVVDEMLNK